MIVTKLQGGHSNQLFQYATGRALAFRRGVAVAMDIQWFESIDQGDTRRIYELDSYRLNQTLVDGRKLALLAEPHAPRFGVLLGRRRQPQQAFVPYRQRGHAFDPKVLDLPDQSLLEGWWQDERYFKDIRRTLLTELEVREPPTGRNVELLRQIRSGPSVSLHVRRGDYVTNPATTAFHGVLGTEYYEAAVERISSLIGQREFRIFVFSNDIEWCSRHLRLQRPTTFVDVGNSGAEDMRLMRNCGHHIVANSSFSWWGAWLGEHPGKVVIAPRRWFSDPDANAETEIVPPGWVRL